MGDDSTLGFIHITYEVGETGEVETSVTTDEDLPLVIQLGLLDMARDTLLRGETGE